MITTKQKIADLQAAIAAREAELWSYELNISTYEQIIALAMQDTVLPESALRNFVRDVEERKVKEEIERRKTEIILLAQKTVLAEFGKKE